MKEHPFQIAPSQALPYDNENGAFRVRDDAYKALCDCHAFVGWLGIIIGEAREFDIPLASYVKMLSVGSVVSPATKNWSRYFEFLDALVQLHS